MIAQWIVHHRYHNKHFQRHLNWLPSKVGMSNPDCAITIIKPSVFNVTVLPPVLGPVIITVSISSINSIVLATTVSLFNSGW